MMELDEAIKHCEDKAKELRKEKRRMAVTGREQEWADCLQCAEEHEQLAEWLTDYKRLKTLESHADSYETDRHCFSYYESKETAGITVWNCTNMRQLEHVNLAATFSHEEFVDWCKAYFTNKEETQE